MDAGGPRTAAAEQGHAAAHSCGSLRGHACGGGADPQYQRQTAGATVDAPTAARRVGHARRLVPTPAHAAKVHKPAWASTQKRGQLPMRWSSESGKKTCSQVDASTEAGFMHSYVVGHIGLDPSQPSILRNGDRGRRESSRQVTTPYRCHAAGRFTIVCVSQLLFDNDEQTTVVIGLLPEGEAFAAISVSAVLAHTVLRVRRLLWLQAISDLSTRRRG